MSAAQQVDGGHSWGKCLAWELNGADRQNWPKQDKRTAAFPWTNVWNKHLELDTAIPWYTVYIVILCCMIRSEENPCNETPVSVQLFFRYSHLAKMAWNAHIWGSSLRIVCTFSGNEQWKCTPQQKKLCPSTKPSTAPWLSVAWKCLEHK